MEGTVKFFDGTKGFGFIKGNDETEYFVHKSEVEAGVRLEEGDEVTFDDVEGDRGPKAENVKLAGSDEE